MYEYIHYYIYISINNYICISYTHTYISNKTNELSTWIQLMTLTITC